MIFVDGVVCKIPSLCASIAGKTSNYLQRLRKNKKYELIIVFSIVSVFPVKGEWKKDHNVTVLLNKYDKMSQRSCFYKGISFVFVQLGTENMWLSHI